VNAGKLLSAAFSLPWGKDQARDLIAEIQEHQAQRGGAHRAGTLTTGPLRAMEHYLQSHFGERPIKTVETGCGASTILLSHYAGKHLAFCYDDRAEANSSVDFATSFPGFDADRVEWIFGPTQQALLRRPLAEEVDLVLIDGPHGYPFPELEYFAFYPWLRPGGVLILDDIHIPTIRNLFDVLREDDMFYPHQVVGTTAFLIRSSAPALSREGDDWWLQRYNVQRFPVDPGDGESPRLRVPFSLSYAGGRLARLGNAFRRGIVLVDGQPVTEGSLAMMRLALDRPLPGRMVVDIEVECVAPGQQPEAAFEAFVNLASLGRRPFRKEKRQSLSVVLDACAHPVIDIKFHVWGHKAADEIAGVQAQTFDKRRLGLILRRVSARALDEAPATDFSDITTRQGAVVSFQCGSQTIRFFVDNPCDPIQARHAAGWFFAWDELDALRRHVAPGVSVLDVGANGGNHTVFFERILGASKVVPIEALPSAIERLRLNAALNQLTHTDLGHLGIALGARSGKGSAVALATVNPRNPRVVEDASGAIRIEPGDAALNGYEPGLIRIDAQRREIDVLQGLSGTIRRCRPILSVNVRDTTREDVEALLRQWGYGTAGEHVRGDTTINLVLKHEGA
jgi:FkbM family methyltransferase